MAEGAGCPVLREAVVGVGRLSFVIEIVADGSTALRAPRVQDHCCRAVSEAEGGDQARDRLGHFHPIQALRDHCGLLRSGGPGTAGA
jgi:hypothetical protein